MAALTLRIHVAWWVRPYLRSIAFFAVLFGMEPDCEKVARTVLKGIRPVIK
jgi:hypothetical protein